MDPDNQQALVTLFLAMTERFEKGYAVGDTRIEDVLAKLRENTNGPTTPGSFGSVERKRA